MRVKRRSLLFLNLFLLAGVVVLAQQLRAAWNQFDQSSDLQATALKTADDSGAQDDAPADSAETARSFPEFLIISERNLFSPDRRPEVIEEVGSEEPRPPPLPKKPELNGVSRIGDLQQAFLTVYEGKKKAQGVRRVVQVGDTVQGYSVKSITEISLTLVWNDHEEVIHLGSSSKPRQSASKSRAAVTVITVGKAGAAVEIASSSEGDQKEGGLDIGVVGAQAGAGRGAAGNAAGGALRSGAGSNRGQGSFGGGRGRGAGGQIGRGRSATGNNPYGLSGTVGVGGANPSPFGRGSRRGGVR